MAASAASRPERNCQSSQNIDVWVQAATNQDVAICYHIFLSPFKNVICHHITFFILKVKTLRNKIYLSGFPEKACQGCHISVGPNEMSQDTPHFIAFWTRVEFGWTGWRCSVPFDRLQPVPAGDIYGRMVGKVVSKDCIFNEDSRYLFKSVVYEQCYQTWPCKKLWFRRRRSRIKLYFGPLIEWRYRNLLKWKWP